MAKLCSRKEKVSDFSTPIDELREKLQKRSGIDDLVNQYDSISQQVKLLTARKSELATAIKEYAMKHGTQDDKGSFNCENDGYFFGQTAKSSVVLKENAIETLRDWGFGDCVVSVPQVDEKLVERYHNDGTLTDENIREIYEVKAGTPSVYVKKKEEMLVIEQTGAKLSRAASRKGKGKR